MDGQTSRLMTDIISKAEAIAKALKNGDVEIRRGTNGITVAEVKRKIIAR